VGGGVSLHVLREKTGIDVPDTTQTVDEWLRIDVLRRQPEPEERVRVRDGEFVVKKTRRSRLFELALDVVKPAADTPATTC
jgi:CBS domain containing-hemolysin-like protein